MSSRPVMSMEVAQAVATAARARVKAARAEDPWRKTARPAQVTPEGDWTVWVIMAGRGFGKTRSGAEWIREEVMSGRRKRLAFVGRTEADVRDIMVEGESGILAVCERYKFSAKYQPSRRRVVFGNGAIAMLYSSREPDLLRGPQHDGYWADEVSTWIKPGTWSNLMFGMRLYGPKGDGPRGVVTMTPRPTATVQAILKRKGMVLTTGTTYENRDNLAEDFFTEIITDYEGTRLGRQELMGELLNALEGALWNHKQLDDLRVEFDEKREYRRVVVAIDPPASDGPTSAECGIIVAGTGVDSHAYVIADRSLKGSPAEWAAAAWRAADEFDADALVFEINQGGAMVRHTLQTARPKSGKPRRLLAIRATKGKILRAEPVAALYEQGRVHHVESLPQLEDQMCSYLPEEQAQRRKTDTGEGQVSPDRLDAMVYGVSELMIGKKTGYTVRPT